MKFRMLIPAHAFAAALALLGALLMLPLPSVAAPDRTTWVRDVDNPALQPFRALISVNLAAGETSKTVIGPTVPTGKTLVIENVSIWIYTSASADIATGVWLTVPNASPATFFLGDPTSTERKLLGGGSITAYNRQVRLYYNADEVINAQVFFDGTNGSKTVNYYLNGYLVNVP